MFHICPHFKCNFAGFSINLWDKNRESILACNKNFQEISRVFILRLSRLKKWQGVSAQYFFLIRSIIHNPYNFLKILFEEKSKWHLENQWKPNCIKFI